MTKPRLLDLCCGGGGATKGYQEAGFYVVGVDIRPQPHYCGDEFYQADALTYPLNGFDAYHASPPCQLWSTGTNYRERYRDLITPIRERLRGLIYVIENVPKAPLRADFKLTGDMVGLTLIKRERWFETNWFSSLSFPLCHAKQKPVITVTGHGTTTGNRISWGRNIKTIEMKKAMGIDWMNRDELSQAIPPAYTQYIGGYLMKAVLELKGKG